MGKTNRLLCSFAAGISVSGMVVLGCTAGPQVSPDAGANDIELSSARVVIMPVTDSREQRFDDLDLGRQVKKASALLLGKKGYTVVPKEHLTGGQRPPFDGVEALTAGELAALGPDGAEVLLFISVDDVARSYNFGGDAYKVMLSGKIVDTDAERIVWHSTGTGTTNYGGLLGALMPDSSQYDAVYEALMDMFRSVPERPRA